MNATQWFWIEVALGIANTLCLVSTIRDRRIFAALFSGLATALVWTVAAFTYNAAYGECAGQSGTTVPFTQGMTLCPGQSAVIEMPPIIVNTKPEREL